MNLSFKHYYWRWIKNLAFLFLTMLILMSLARLTFSFVFGDWTQLKNQFPDLRSALWLGLRYDLMPLSYINVVPFILIHLGYFIPGKSAIKVLRFSIVGFLTFGYLALVWLYICDYGFYSYFQDHLNILFFGFFEDDTWALLTSIWKNYNLPLWLGIIFLGNYAVYRLVKFFFSPFDFDLKAKSFDMKMIPSFFTGLILLAFFARGNFTRLPLSLEDAHISSDEFINEISLNGALTFNRALKIRKMFTQKDVNYLSRFGFSDWKEAFKVSYGQVPGADNLTDSLKAKTPYNAALAKKSPHVVLVVMESFGSYWNDQHNAQTFNILGSLEDHFSKGILFKNFLSSENGTIGSIVSVATSQVIRPGSRFLSESDFMKTPLQIAGHLPYKQAGYDTHFIYGGKLGWRDLGKYLKVQKYDKLWGADEIKDSMPELSNIEAKDLGNEWGIFDEYLYSFIEEQIRTANRPQFFLVMTTSNHPPFEYPSSYNTLPLKMDKEFRSKVTVSDEIARKRFIGLQYANQKIGEFLTRIENGALSDNVVVALTGDHSFWIAKGVGLDKEFKRFAVPFFLSVPERIKPKSYHPENFGSHEDIFPTLYNLTLSNQEYLKLGEDLLNEEGTAQNSSGLVANKKGASHNKSFWTWKSLENQLLIEAPGSPELKELKRKGLSLIGLTDFYLKEEKSRKRSAAKDGRPKQVSP